jgi:beta-lactamase superfamily II metal-dependent hydrolase
VGGGANDGVARKNVFRFLNALKIKTIDMLIVPNSTANGVGVLRELVSFYDVRQVYLPMNSGTNAEYSAFVADLSREGIPAYTTKSGLLMGGDGTYALRALLPLGDGSTTEDTLLSLSYRGVDFLLGDGYAKDCLSMLLNERELGLWDKWGEGIDDFEIVQSSTRIDAELFSAFGTAFGCEGVIFSCRGGEGYTPNEDVLTALTELGVNTHRTDLNGYISVSVHTENEYTITMEK